MDTRTDTIEPSIGTLTINPVNTLMNVKQSLKQVSKHVNSLPVDYPKLNFYTEADFLE